MLMTVVQIAKNIFFQILQMKDIMEVKLTKDIKDPSKRNITNYINWRLMLKEELTDFKERSINKFNLKVLDEFQYTHQYHHSGIG